MKVDLYALALTLPTQNNLKALVGHLIKTSSSIYLLCYKVFTLVSNINKQVLTNNTWRVLTISVWVYPAYYVAHITHDSFTHYFVLKECRFCCKIFTVKVKTNKIHTTKKMRSRLSSLTSETKINHQVQVDSHSENHTNL